MKHLISTAAHHIWTAVKNQLFVDEFFIKTNFHSIEHLFQIQNPLSSRFVSLLLIFLTREINVQMKYSKQNGPGLSAHLNQYRLMVI